MSTQDHAESREPIHDTRKKLRSTDSYPSHKFATLLTKKRIISVQRVSKVVKGGRKMSFRASIAAGNGHDRVAVGMGKSPSTLKAIEKGKQDANYYPNGVQFDLTKDRSIAHDIVGRYRAAKIRLMQRRAGTGLIAGGAVRSVLSVTGIENISCKQFGSRNLLNNAKAVLKALDNLIY
jgi:small subunit ribosomal protein S5